ncbi:MAG TPA: hypothetical protein VLX44_18760 [Xanthobacteraceae bacterium]|nr:hypothetical protein [Xanthobacteraceae bacterium]
MPIASPLSSTPADPPPDGALAPAAAKDRFTGVEEALAKLAHQAAGDAPELRGRAHRPDSAAALPLAATLRPADFRAPLPGEKPRKPMAGAAGRLLIAACIGAAAMVAWRSYGSAAREMVAAYAPRLGAIAARTLPNETAESPAPRPAAPAAAPPAVTAPTPSTVAAEAPRVAPQAAPNAQPAAVAPSESAAASADHQHIEAMARDLAALRQSVEQLTALQEQLKGEIARLQAEKLQAEKRIARRMTPLAPPPVAAPAHRAAMPPTMLPMRAPIPAPPPAAPQVSNVSPPMQPLPPPPLPPPPLSPPPQMSTEPQPAMDPPPMRPPMPVPQP